ncbi:cell adhesion molecule-like protein, partial [Leptotrombidium deliense]
MEGPPKFLEVFTDHELKVGDHISLKCMATGNPFPQITWTLDDQALDNFKNVRIGDYVTADNNVISFVNISSINIENGGHYTCRAANGFETIENVALILVFGPPFVRFMNNVTSIEHKTLTIRCPVGGHPITSIFWEKDGKRLPINHKQSINSNNGTLTIKEVSKEIDEGFYSCIASNKEGQQASNGLFLTIKGSTIVITNDVNSLIIVAPRIEPFLISNNVNIGQRLSITCTVIKGDPPILIKWLKNGQLINEHDAFVSIHHLADYSSTILFKSINSEHKGNYTCSATNEVGQDSYSTDLVVFAPPFWLYEPGDVSAKKGNQLWVNCQSSGFPQPRIVWKKAQNLSAMYKTITSSIHIQILDNGTLYIDDIQKSDAGDYLCQASNGIGSDLSKIIHISVHEAAHFKTRFKADSARKNDDVTLSCEAFGERPISVEWSKDNKAMFFDHRVYSKETSTDEGIVSQLIIRNVARPDSALYSCNSHNAYGKDETRIQLIVQEPPESPVEVKLSEIKSRSAHVSWSPPFSGNSRINKYFVYLEQFEENTKFVVDKRNVTVAALETSTTIKDLKPLTKYSLSISAVNEIGVSERTPFITFETLEEVPSEVAVNIKAFAISSKAIKVTWNPPDNRYSFGKIRGYYIGYKVWNTKDAFTYKTLAVESRFKPEMIFKNLKRNTKYEIVIQSYNSKGAGPFSPAIVVQTHHQDPPETPSLALLSTTASTITVSWTLSDQQNEIIGQLHFSKNDVIEKSISSSLQNYTFLNLFCGTFYDITIRAFNTIGNSDKSSSLRVKTSGTAAIAPNKESLISHLNSTSVSVDLSSWKTVECEINYFSVKYKLEDEKMWTIVSNRIETYGNRLTIDGLHPQKWYTLQCTSFSEAGKTEAEYAFVTPAVRDKEKFPVIYNDSKYKIFFELELILPLVLSLLVVIAVFTLICVVMNKRTDQSIYSDSQQLSKSNLTTDLLSMSNLDKTKAKSVQMKEQATAYFALDSSSVQNCNSAMKNRCPHQSTDQKYFDEIQYATVKRTPRLPKLERNIYDCPVINNANELMMNGNETDSAMSDKARMS